MKLVVDASVVAALAFPDERPPQVVRLAGKLSSSDVTIAPRLFWYEIHAIALKKERRGRLTAARVDEAIRLIRELPIELIDVPASFDTLGLARRHDLTFYDAAYLALALCEGAKLATLDEQLARAARKEATLIDA